MHYHIVAFDGNYTAENKKFANRLRLLRNKLQSLPDERFSYRTWAGSTQHPFMGRRDLSCGTSACALGWATTLDFAKKAGVRLRLINGTGLGEVMRTDLDGPLPGESLFGPKFDLESMAFGFLFLGEIPWLDRGEDESLQGDFGEGLKASRKQVINRIDAFVEYSMGYEFTHNGRFMVRVES